jgi:peptidoglycan/LPS O-acetylase OafA/YrhL
VGTLRLLLALSVVLFHSGPFVFTGSDWVGGIVAVEGFFVVSGFYMALVLHQRYGHRLRDFYANRLLRLYPLYWAALALYLVAGWIEPSIDRFAALWAVDRSASTWALMLSANLLLVGADWMLLFSASTEGLQFAPEIAGQALPLFKYHYLPQSWSLPIELAFYAIAPWLVFHRWRLLLVAVMSLATKYGLVFGAGLGDPWFYRVFPLELWLFCLGALAFHAFVSLSPRWRLAALRWPVLLGLSAFILFYGHGDAGAKYDIASLRYATFLCALLLALPVLFAGFKDSAWDRWLGELSYPIYLIHLLVIGVVVKFDLRLAGDQSVLILLGCIAAAAVLVHAVGRPIEARFKRRVR